MYKNFAIFLASLLLVVVGCNRQEIVPANQGSLTSISLSIPGEMNAVTKAGEDFINSAKGGVTNVGGDLLQWNVKIYNGTRPVYDVTATGASFTQDFQLVAGESYRLEARAGFENAGDFNAENEDFYVVDEIFTAGASHSAVLKRNRGKLRLIADDYDFAMNQMGKEVKSVKVSYTRPTALADLNSAINTYSDDAVGTKTLFVDYLDGADSGAEMYSFEITVYFDEAQTDFKTYTIAQDIPIKANALTTVRGNLFTGTTNISIVIDENFEYEEEIENGNSVVNVSTAAGLLAILNDFGAPGAGDNTVNITEDITLAPGEIWTPARIDGYQGAGVVTINGNGHTISGLTAPLLSGGFAGNAGIKISNLTIENSTMTSTHSTGAGGFIEYVDAIREVTLENCHLLNSSITTTSGRLGGIIGYTAGHEQNPMVVTIKNCSVEGCTLTSTEAIGAINGHGGANQYTTTLVENCSIKDVTINSSKVSSSRVVGLVVGTANVGEYTINGFTYSGTNTVEQNGVNYTDNQLYGRFVPGTTGKLTIDGSAI